MIPASRSTVEHQPSRRFNRVRPPAFSRDCNSMMNTATVPHRTPILVPAVLSCLALFVCLPVNAAADEEKAIVPEEVKLGRPVEFQRDIYPILQANCLACHNKAKPEGDLSLENAAAVLEGGGSGDTIIPGKPDESYLYQLAARIEESYMPPIPNEVQAKKLTPAQLGLLRQWILEGAKAGDSDAASTMQWQAINNQLNAIYAVDADPYGRFVAAGRAGNVDVYDLQLPEHVAQLKDPSLEEIGSASQTAHRDYVHSIAFHPNGQMIATSGYQIVKLWNRNTAANIVPVALPATTVKIVSSADAKVAAVHQADGVIRVIDLQTKAVLNELPGHDPATITLLGVHGAENQWVSVSNNADTTLKMINRADNAVVATSEGLGAKATEAVFVVAKNKLVVRQEDGSLRPVAFDAAAKTLVAAEAVKSDKGAIAQITLSGAVVMARTETTVELRNAETLAPGVVVQCAGPITHAAVSRDAQRVVTLAADGKPELWNAADGKLIAALNVDISTSRALARRAADKAVRDARVTVVKGMVTEDEKRVTEQKESLKKADEEIKKATEALPAPKKKLEEAVAKTAAAKTASEAKGDDAALKKALEAAQKAEKTAMDAVTAAENTLKSANKGKKLTEQAIVRAEAKVEDRKKALAGVEAEAKTSTEAHTVATEAAKATVTSTVAAFVATSLVATVDASGTTRLWKSTDGGAVDALTAAVPEAAKPVAVTGTTDGLIVQQADGVLSAINASTHWTLQKVLGPQGENKKSVFVDRVLAVAFSPDGNTLAAGGGEASRSGELTLWNVADGTLLKSFQDAHSDTVYGVDFSADGKLLASAAADKFVKVFNLESGQHVRSYEGHTHHVMDVSWKGDGTALVSAGADNAIKVWNAETGEQSRTIKTYKKQVTSLQFVGMEDEFISCSGDKRVFRHKASNGGTVREFKGSPDYVYSSATTPDGALVAAGGEDGVLRVWNGKDGKEIQSFKPVVP